MQQTSGPTVCETNTRIYVWIAFFFLLLLLPGFGFTKMCMQLWTGSKVMLGPRPFNAAGAGRGLGPKTEDGHWLCASRQISLIGYFHIHRDARTEQSICFFSRTLHCSRSNRMETARWQWNYILLLNMLVIYSLYTGLVLGLIPWIVFLWHSWRSKQ